MRAGNRYPVRAGDKTDIDAEATGCVGLPGRFRITAAHKSQDRSGLVRWDAMLEPRPYIWRFAAQKQSCLRYRGGIALHSGLEWLQEHNGCTRATKLMKSFRSDFGVFACPHVFTGQSAVRLIVRDHDGSWQFLCGDDELTGESDEPHFVHVVRLIERDPSLRVARELEPGTYVEREQFGANWERGSL